MTHARKWPQVGLYVWMIVAVLVVATIADWDARTEASRALSDFGGEQAALARSLAEAVSARVRTPRDADDANAFSEVANAVPKIDQPGTSIVLLAKPNASSWSTVDGRNAVFPWSPSDSEKDWDRLERPDAAAVGLPERTAVAGFASFDLQTGKWRLAVVTSAEHERDRERRAQARLVLSVLLAAGLVIIFGGIALRNQRKELGLARELAIADIERGLDDRLVRADKIATLGALAIGVAHEIATPLSVIIGRSEQLVPHLEDEQAKKNINVVLEQCNRIDRVVRGMLALARGDSPVLERVAPETVARAAVDLVSHRFVSAGVTLRLDVAEGLPSIACEPRLLEQAIANLLLNARDACEAKTGHVELRVESRASRVDFVVTDNGKGIAAESMVRVTEPFFTTKSAEKGTGLGLSIANEIVKHNRGTLSVAPRAVDGEPTGTRACIEIPAVPRDT